MKLHFSTNKNFGGICSGTFDILGWQNVVNSCHFEEGGGLVYITHLRTMIAEK